MKKLLKILLWLVGILAVLVVLAVIGLKLFFPLEKIRAMAVDEGSARLGRPIEVAGLDISVWGGLGVELEGVRVGNPEGIDAPDLLSADRVDLKLRLLPLITGDFRVDRLIIDSPTLPIASGIMPTIVVAAVISIGRSRARPAAISARERLLPRSRRIRV